MAFSNKRRVTRITPLKVATTIIISSYDDGSGTGPRCVKWYFLVRELNGKYYEIFSKKQLEKETDIHYDLDVENHQVDVNLEGLSLDEEVEFMNGKKFTERTYHQQASNTAKQSSYKQAYTERTTKTSEKKY